MDTNKPTDTTKQTMGTEEKGKESREQTPKHDQEKTKEGDERTTQHSMRSS